MSLNLIKHRRPDIDKSCFYKGPFESKYQFLINGRENIVFSKAFNTEFDDIVITFTDQNVRLLDKKQS